MHTQGIHRRADWPTIPPKTPKTPGSGVVLNRRESGIREWLTRYILGMLDLRGWGARNGVTRYASVAGRRPLRSDTPLRPKRGSRPKKEKKPIPDRSKTGLSPAALSTTIEPRRQLFFG